MPDVPPTPDDASSRSWLVRLLLAGALLLTLMMALAAWLILHSESHLDRIRAAGDPASIAELAPDPVPPEQNAAAILHAVAPRLREFASEHARFFKTDLGKAFEKRPEGEPPTPAELDAIAAIVARYDDLIGELNRVAAAAAYASLLDFSAKPSALSAASLNTIQNFRTAARLLAWQSLVEAESGNADAALQAAITNLQLARHLDHEPMIVNLLVAYAVRASAFNSAQRVVGESSLSPAARKELEEELARHDLYAALVSSLKTERAFSIESLREQLGGSTLPGKLLAGPIYRRQLDGILEMYDAILPRIGRTSYELYRDADYQRTVATPNQFGAIAALLAPNIVASSSAADRITAQLRALRIANVIAGASPQPSLEDVDVTKLGLPDDATVDPYSGARLKVHKIPEGFVVYSVGSDGVDDGGAELDNSFKDVGVKVRTDSR